MPNAAASPALPDVLLRRRRRRPDENQPRFAGYLRDRLAGRVLNKTLKRRGRQGEVVGNGKSRDKTNKSRKNDPFHWTILTRGGRAGIWVRRLTQFLTDQFRFLHVLRHHVLGLGQELVHLRTAPAVLLLEHREDFLMTLDLIIQVSSIECLPS